MEGDTFNTIQAEVNQVPTAVASLPKLSFVPDDLMKKYEGPMGLREKCARAGLVAGGISLVSWVVIVFGVVTSIIGAGFSIAGLRSARAKHAKIGLVLSVVGLAASFGYAFAISQGKVNYDYFVNEFWDTVSGVETGAN